MKYIIDIPDDNISDFLTLGDDKRLRLPIYNKNGTFNSFIHTNLIVIPYTELDMAETLYLYKCYITDKDGLQHEVIHTGDIRRVTGWEI